MDTIGPSSAIESGGINGSDSGTGAEEAGVGDIADSAKADKRVEANLGIRKAGSQAQSIDEKGIVLAGEGANVPRRPGTKGVGKGLEGSLNAGEKELLG